MRTLLSVLFLIILLTINATTTSTAESVLPLLRHPYGHLSSLLSPFAVEEDFSDPFKILEHVPFGLERDVQLVTGPARVDWKETPDSHILMLDVPGLKREELKIEVDENRVLRISGERKKEEEKKDDRWHRVERIYGKFVRLFRLPENVNMDTAKARLENGVLTVALPKLSPDHAKRTPKTVAIESEQGSPKEIIPGKKEGESESKNEL